MNVALAELWHSFCCCLVCVLFFPHIFISRFHQDTVGHCNKLSGFTYVAFTWPSERVQDFTSELSSVLGCCSFGSSCHCIGDTTWKGVQSNLPISLSWQLRLLQKEPSGTPSCIFRCFHQQALTSNFNLATLNCISGSYQSKNCFQTSYTCGFNCLTTGQAHHEARQTTGDDIGLSFFHLCWLAIHWDLRFQDCY